MFLYFIYFAGSKWNNTTTTDSVINMTFFVKHNCALIGPPKCQDGITWGPTKLALERGVTTGSNVEEPAI